jgi:hypothetical protein
MWEINVLDLLAQVLEHDAAFQRDRAQMRRQQRELVWRQCRQETIESGLLKLPGNRGRAIRHRCRSCVTTGVRSDEIALRKWVC